MREFGRFNDRLTVRNIVSIVMHAFESVTKTISQLSDYITLSRATYSILLLLIIALLLKSLIATWPSGKITVGEFDYFADEVKKADFCEQIRAETFEFYNLIVKLIQQEAERTRMENGLSNQKNKEEEDKSERLPAIRNEQLADLNSNSGELQQLEITVQGINIKNLFSSLGAFVTPSSRELKASIFSSNNTRRVFVTAPSINNRKEARPVPSFISGGVESDTATAFRIACYMIWSQWDAASLDSDFGVNLSEFCRVARLLYIRTTFDALPSYEFQKLKFKDEVEFLKETYQLAALAGPDYGLIYSSLRGLERYFGDEKVNLTPTTTATIDSLVDLVGFFSLQTGQTRDPRGHWTDGLPPDVTERKVIDRAYFAQQISNDCDAPDPIVKRRNIPDSVRSQFDNVVRILSKQDNQTVVRTGLIISDEVVITVGNYGHSQELETLPDGTEIQIVSCGKIIETHKMKSVGPVSATGKSPYLRLVVPGLKAKAPTPSFPTA